jgi:DNA-directed RNA polymerase specialized sigma24 family protein
MDTRTYAPAPERWQRALDGDRDAFEEAVAPLQDDLLDAARRQVAVERQAGHLREDALTPEELAGEALLRAYEHRAGFDPKRLRFRAWLLGIQHRALARLAAEEASYDDRKAISLNEEVPTREDEDAVEEEFYNFRQPFTVTTYEDLVAGSAPDDVEIDLDRPDRLTDEERALLDTADLEPTARRVALFHDEFELSLEEVAQILNTQLNDVAESYNLARTTLRERLGNEPLPEDDSPAVDSYTGDPL